MGLFGLFLFVAAYSTGSRRADLFLGSLTLIAVSAWVLHKRPARFEPSRRFRTLRRLGLVSDKDKNASSEGN